MPATKMKNHSQSKTIISFILLSLLSSCHSVPEKNNSIAVPVQMSKKSKVESPLQKQMPDIIGVDISKYQGKVDFNKLKDAGVHYVFIRATEGITYQDADYVQNHNDAKAAGLRVGVYHFYETDDNPQAQFENFKNRVNLTSGDLAPVIDIEKLHQKDDKNLVENLKQFLSDLESHFGIKPIVYSGKNFANKYLTGFGDYPLWLAEYQMDQPVVPSGWQDWTFWQWSQSGTIDGIEGLSLIHI